MLPPSSLEKPLYVRKADADLVPSKAHSEMYSKRYEEYVAERIEKR